MAVSYPPSLPQDPQRNSFNVTQKSNVITSEVDIGEAKKRRRYTDPIINEAWSMILSPDQLIDFNTFFNVELGSGVNRFEFFDTFLGVQKQCRIMDMPKYKPYGSCGFYMVSFNVELLP